MIQVSQLREECKGQCESGNIVEKKLVNMKGRSERSVKIITDEIF
jgi:hypothetical protein